MASSKQYINPNRLEFTITDACSGKCKHCSKGELTTTGKGIDPDKAVTALKQLAGRFSIDSIMTFGGEPLLFADTVCKIHEAARDCGIPQRQIITNGFFSKDAKKVDSVAKALWDAGVNNVLLSVDAFHQEFIPIGPVLQFAELLLQHGIPYLRVHPAWVVNEAHNNFYNTETKRLLKLFADKGIYASSGNDIFPSGNAVKYLGEYFPPPAEVDLSEQCGSAPYTSRLDEIDSIGINPDGTVVACTEIGNIYDNDILSIVDSYDPYNDPILRTILDDGVEGLLRFAKEKGITVDMSDCGSACGVCRKLMKEIQIHV